MKTRLAAAASVALLAACAGGAPRRGASALDEYLPYAGPAVASFHFFRLDGWYSVDDAHVVIETAINTAYLITLYAPCPELGFTERLGLTSTAGTVSHFEAVIVRDYHRCPIAEMRPLDVRRMRAERLAAHASGPR